jgi:hypothetical protein
VQVGRTRRSLVALAFVAGAAGAVAGPVAGACAGEGARAALVVDTGSAVTTYCVALPDDSVTGIQLVELAGDQHGLDYSLGFGGEAVCRLEGVGPEGDDCFGEYPEFWGYWHGDGSGGWTWAGTGAGSASIGDGDVDAWSWGAGDNGSNHQQPPSTVFSDVCAVAGKPADGGAGRQQPRGEDDVRPTAAPGAATAPPPSPDVSGEEPERRRPRAREEAKSDRRRPRREVEHKLVPVTPSPAGSPVATRPAAGESTGPPVTGLVGVAAAGALAAAVWAGARRRGAPGRPAA